MSLAVDLEGERRTRDHPEDQLVATPDRGRARKSRVRHAHAALSAMEDERPRRRRAKERASFSSRRESLGRESGSGASSGERVTHR